MLAFMPDATLAPKTTHVYAPAMAAICPFRAKKRQIDAAHNNFELLRLESSRLHSDGRNCCEMHLNGRIYAQF